MKTLLTMSLGLVVALACETRADIATYYIGREDRAPGQQNANQGHLTFLLAHGDHFHRLGPYGGVEGRIPESYVGGELSLFAGEGAFAGRFVSAAYHIDDDAVSEYSDLEIRPFSTLEGFDAGTPESILFNGGQQYLGDLSGTNVALELVSISDGFYGGDAAGNILFASAGDQYVLGAGDSFDWFTPVFWTEVAATPLSNYTATFRLVDLNGVAGQSGTFRYEFRAVPEPTSLALVGLGLSGLILARRMRRTAIVRSTI